MRPINPRVGNPVQLPPKDRGTGGGPRNPTSMPPRDPGTGAGPRNPTSMPRPTSMPMTNVKPAMNMKKGGSVGSASKRADGCAVKGKTRGTMIAMKGGGYAC